MNNPRLPSRADAIDLARDALIFIAADEDLLLSFLYLSGLTPDDARIYAADPDFLAGVLDFLLFDDKLVTGVVDKHGIALEMPKLARLVLGNDYRD
ncbi:MAG: DUF3572 family protein [Pseudomonadota bacterium]|nr:DUF3572 family protein [Pseudomonadota bacterium]